MTSWIRIELPRLASRQARGNLFSSINPPLGPTFKVSGLSDHLAGGFSNLKTGLKLLVSVVKNFLGKIHNMEAT